MFAASVRPGLPVEKEVKMRLMARCKNAKDTVMLVCDFQEFLTTRVLDIYRFFQRSPNMILVRRGQRFSIDRRISVKQEVIPLPAIGLEKTTLANLFRAVLSMIGYLMYSVVIFLKTGSGGNRVRLVHAHFIIPQGVFGFLVSRMFRAPLVVTAVGKDVNVFMRNRLLRVVCLQILNRAYVTIAVSRPLQEQLIRHGVPNVVYIPNSVDHASVTEVDRSRSENSIIFIGSMTSRKRPLVLLKAFEIVAERNHGARLVMVGEGPLRRAVEEEIRKKNLDTQVKVFPRE